MPNKKMHDHAILFYLDSMLDFRFGGASGVRLPRLRQLQRREPRHQREDREDGLPSSFSM